MTQLTMPKMGNSSGVPESSHLLPELTEELIELAASAAHEVNRSYSTGLGDHSHKSWEDSPMSQRNSSIAGVRCIIENPHITPEQLHEAWLQQKLYDGWGYGPTKSEELQLHPCMIPYERLPEAQRVKDYLFGNTVRRVLGLI